MNTQPHTTQTQQARFLFIYRNTLVSPRATSRAIMRAAGPTKIHHSQISLSRATTLINITFRLPVFSALLEACQIYSRTTQLNRAT